MVSSGWSFQWTMKSWMSSCWLSYSSSSPVRRRCSSWEHTRTSWVSSVMQSSLELWYVMKSMSCVCGTCICDDHYQICMCVCVCVWVSERGYILLQYSSSIFIKFVDEWCEASSWEARVYVVQSEIWWRNWWTAACKSPPPLWYTPYRTLFTCMHSGTVT